MTFNFSPATVELATVICENTTDFESLVAATYQQLSAHGAKKYLQLVTMAKLRADLDLQVAKEIVAQLKGENAL